MFTVYQEFTIDFVCFTLQKTCQGLVTQSGDYTYFGEKEANA